MNLAQTINQLRGVYFKERNAYIVGGEPAIFHCHHYNCYLQAVILDTKDYLKGVEPLLVNCSQEIAHTQFTSYFSQGNFSIDSRKSIVEDYFRFCGFGKIDLSKATERESEIVTLHEHYGIGWKTKFGISSMPVAYFTAGFLAGSIEAIFDLPLGTLECLQLSCIAMGDEESKFSVKPTSLERKINASQREGKFMTHDLVQPSGTSVDYEAIRTALTQMPIEGSEDSGLINAFGVLLTRHYANYYCNISNGFLELFSSVMGDDGKQTALELLTEAGHVCAFNTFGGIMQSNEWNAMIKPMLSTQEDWVHGIVAVVNAFGWGHWEIEELIPGQKLVTKIISGYESNSFLGKYSNSTLPISFLATGGTAGLMNLIYVLDLPKKAPLTLDDETYKIIHNNPGFFSTKQIRCRSLGDPYDVFVTERKVQ